MSACFQRWWLCENLNSFPLWQNWSHEFGTGLLCCFLYFCKEKLKKHNLKKLAIEAKAEVEEILISWKNISNKNFIIFLDENGWSSCYFKKKLFWIGALAGWMPLISVESQQGRFFIVMQSRLFLLDLLLSNSVQLTKTSGNYRWLTGPFPPTWESLESTKTRAEMGSYFLAPPPPPNFQGNGAHFYLSLWKGK